MPACGPREAGRPAQATEASPSGPRGAAALRALPGHLSCAATEAAGPHAYGKPSIAPLEGVSDGHRLPQGGPSGPWGAELSQACFGRAAGCFSPRRARIAVRAPPQALFPQSIRAGRAPPGAIYTKYKSRVRQWAQKGDLGALPGPRAGRPPQLRGPLIRRSYLQVGPA